MRRITMVMAWLSLAWVCGCTGRDAGQNDSMSAGADAMVGDPDASVLDGSVRDDGGPAVDASGSQNDASVPDASSSSSSSSGGGQDGGTADASVADGGGPVCGNSVVEDGEACDGDTHDCQDLAGSFGAGTASCRNDCQGWAVTTCPVVSVPRFEIVKPALRDPRWATARCNDGTPFAAQVRLRPASPVWVIHLEGGVHCDDNSRSCAQRLADDPGLTTTLPPADKSLLAGPDRGILNDDPTVNPDFANANHVFMHYCSSDFWAGATTERRPSTADPQGWYYSGRTNVRALLEVLKERYNMLDSRPALQILFTGSSAGAHGAHFNARALTQMFPNAHAGARIKLLADAGWMFDWDHPEARIINTTVEDREVWRNAVAFWGAHLDPVCEAMETDPMNCWFGVGWYPYISALVPVFVQQSRLDGSFGGYLHGPNWDPEVWLAEAEASLVNVEWLWSGADVYHTLIPSDPGWATGTSPDTLREAVGRFWNGGEPERILWSP